MRAVRNLITKLQETPPKEKEKIDNFHVTSSLEIINSLFLFWWGFL
jgi:hypothetical protein